MTRPSRRRRPDDRARRARVGSIGFVQDATGGIGLYLDAAVAGSHPAGTTIRVTGTLGTRYHQRVLRIAEADIAFGATGALPARRRLATGQVGEAAEGSRGSSSTASSSAARTRSPTDSASTSTTAAASRGRSSDPRRSVRETIASGDVVTVTGPLGQRDSGGTGLGGLSRLCDAARASSRSRPPTPTPSPTPTPTPTPDADADARRRRRRPHPPPTPTPTPDRDRDARAPSPTPSADPVDRRPRDSARSGPRVTVRAVVTAEAGRLGTERLFAIGDATAGIVVRLPVGESGPARGAMVVVTGVLAAPYGQLEVRPTAGHVARRWDGAAAGARSRSRQRASVSRRKAGSSRSSGG